MIRTVLTIVLGTILLLAPASAASRHAAVRVSVTDGMSILVPGGWNACDAPTAKLLGSVPYPVNLGPCNGFDGRGGAKMIFGNDTAHPLFVSMAFSPDLRLPAGFLENATPEMLKEFGASNCEKTFHIQVGQPGADCHYAVETFNGHFALVGYVSETDRHGAVSAVRSVMFFFHGGGAILMFGMPKNNAQGVVDGILASVALDAPTSMVTVTTLIKLSPAAGVTLSVPDNWDACDEQTNARLGDKPASPETKGAVCRNVADFKVYNPDPVLLSSLRLGRADSNRILDNFTDQSTPESLAPIKDELCREATRKFVAGGIAIDSCDVTIGALAGHRALVFEVVSRGGSMPAVDASRIYSREYDFSYSHGFLAVMVDTPLDSKTATIPALEAILASLKVE
ncbi:MAG TPA: hypothetical protein VHZ78_13970 [Rhizomicrobium sp.]|jgi:hypothetical protein|nr:hypothetical protein [Rhizomicrobium sp.]